MANVKVQYTCECCGWAFDSGRVRSGEKLCGPCISLRRTLKSYINHGLSAEEVLTRARKMLKVE